MATATPGDPYRPARRFVSLVEGSGTLRGFNTTHMVPLALDDAYDRVGVGGYDETTGATCVFVDTDATIACEWAERTDAVYRERSTPLSEHGRAGEKI